MLQYTGTKEVKARPMTLGEYNDYRGWDLPSDEDAAKEVYLVEYAIDPESPPNHADHAGYITMSPKHVFDKAYRRSGTFQDRLQIEINELESKIGKLDSALEGKKVTEESVLILELQLTQMNAYLYTLNKRMDLLVPVKINENLK